MVSGPPKHERPGEGGNSVGRPVVHFEIIARDRAALQRFYGELFDWKIDDNNTFNYGMVETGGQGINGGIGSTEKPGDEGVSVYVQVPDLLAALDQAERLGGKTVMPPMEIPGAGVHLAQFTDPEGNIVGLIKG